MRRSDGRAPGAFVAALVVASLLSGCTASTGRVDSPAETGDLTNSDASDGVGLDAATTEAVLTGERIVAEGLRLPDVVRRNRAVNALSPLTAKTVIRLSDFDGDIVVQGRVDPTAGMADLKFEVATDSTNIRFVDDVAYAEIPEEERATYLADWYEIDLSGATEIPPIVQLAKTVTSRPDLLASVSAWSDVSTSAETATKRTHLRGTGKTTSLLGDVEGMLDDTDVDIWFDSSFFIERLDWHIKPDTVNGLDGGQEVTSTTTYTRGQPLSTVKPKGQIADYSKVQEIAAAAEERAAEQGLEPTASDDGAPSGSGAADAAGPVGTGESATTGEQELVDAAAEAATGTESESPDTTPGTTAAR